MVALNSLTVQLSLSDHLQVTMDSYTHVRCLVWAGEPTNKEIPEVTTSQRISD